MMTMDANLSHINDGSGSKASSSSNNTLIRLAASPGGVGGTSASASASSTAHSLNPTPSSSLISLKVRLVDSNIIKTLQFNPSTLVYDALKMIREKIPETNAKNANNYGLFIPNNHDSSKGTWLENGRTLDYYMLKNGDILDYLNKFRKLSIRILDGTTKLLLVDDSQTVGQLMIYICSQMGIANYEEYSLIHDIPESEKERTLTLKKHDKTLQRDYKKMEELKKKLHTDDDIAWLDHSKTLRQQNIDESSTLILKRKLFFSDKNIDTRDPVQLNLLYVQCRDAIINGTHPISEEEAIKFAAIQCQCRFKDFDSAVHRSGFLDLKEYLPKEYVKVKGIEKKIYQEYKSLAGLKELDAKLKYTQLCRSLKTYGVTFFLVKEKMKGKNKLVARLLGITKESIVRVDEKTKEFLNVYPLECVKKWAASPNTFTLDFGDHYKEPYYSMQTTEGEHIARLISGYIDIILKKKKSREYNGTDAIEESSPLLEEVISPHKATIVQMVKNTNQQHATDGNASAGALSTQESNGFSNGSIVAQNSTMSRQAQLGYTSELHDSKQDIDKSNSAQKPLITTIQNARSIISTAQTNLQQRPVIGDIGNDPASMQWKLNMLDANRQKVTSHLSAMNAATAQVVTLTSGGSNVPSDYNAIGAAVSTISTNLADFSKDIMMISALKEEYRDFDDDDNLLDAAKKLCSAFADFLKHVEPDCTEPRQNLFSSVGRIGEAGNDIMRSINGADQVNANTGVTTTTSFDTTADSRLQESFISLAKQVASSTAGLVISSKNVANHCTSQQGVNEVISLVTQCALSTSQLVTCTKVCSSTIGSRECQAQIIEAARQVSRQVDAVIEVASSHCQDENSLVELKTCAKNVTDTVMQLLENVKSSNEQLVFHSSSILVANTSSRMDNAAPISKACMASNQNSEKSTAASTNSSSAAMNLALRQDESIEKIFNATDALFNCMGDASEMIRQAKVLAQATTDLVNSLKQEAHAVQPSAMSGDQQRKLLVAAKLLADATSRMVEAAKGCATNPHDESMQAQLKKAAEELKNATTIAAGDTYQIKLIKRLELCAKQCASCATQSIAAIQVCTLHNNNSSPSPSSDESSGGEQQANGGVQMRVQHSQTHNQLVQQCKVVADNVPKIVQGIRGCMVAPRSKSAHLGLINSCEDFVQPTQKMISLSKAVLPTISDEIKAIQLRNCSNQLAAALSELKACLCQSQEVCASFEAETMIESLRHLDKDLLDVKEAADAQILKPLPGESLELCETQLAAISKTVGLSMAQMLTAAAQNNELYTGIAAKDTLNALRSFTSSIRAIVACSAANSEYQERLIESARLVLDQSVGLVNETRMTLSQPNAAETSLNQQRLAQIARTIAQSLYECVNCLPGQKDIDEVLKSIADVSSSLFGASNNQKSSLIPSANSTNIIQVQEDLNQSALNLNQSTNQIVLDSRRGSASLSESAYQYSAAYTAFFQNCLIFNAKLASHNESLINAMKELFSSSNKLLQSAKSCIADPQASNGRQQLAMAAKQVTECINMAVSVCMEATDESNPHLQAQQECDNALRDIETTRTIVQHSPENGNDFLVISEPPAAMASSANGRQNGGDASSLTSYYDCLDHIIDKSRLLGESMTGIANSCKEPTKPELFTLSIRDTSASICGLVETAAHSAFIIGVSDVESKRGRAAILDSNHFLNCSQRIQDTCANLQQFIRTANSQQGSGGGRQAYESQKQQLIQAATQIAQNTASLCNASQQASNRTSNVLAKRHFVQSAKQVANTTANFVKNIKSLDSQSSETRPIEFTHESYAALVKPLLESVESLCQYALSPDFSSIPASISKQGAKAQQPILSATRTMLDAAAQLVQASRSLIANNKDPQMWQLFSTNSKLISESIKRLATAIKEKAPAKHECDQALSIIEKCMKHLESSLLSVAMGQPLPLSDLANAKSLEAYQEHAISCSHQIMELVDQVRTAAKGEADKLGYIVTEISQYFEPLVVNVIGCTAKTPFDTQLQSCYLEQAKTVLESALQLLVASKESAGNPKNISNLHQAIDENGDGTKEVLDDLIQTLEEATAQRGHVASMIDNLTRAISKIDFTKAGHHTTMATIEEQQEDAAGGSNRSSSSNNKRSPMTYIDYQTRILNLTKLMQKNAQDLNMCSLSELGQSAQQLTQTFNSLSSECLGAMETCPSNETANALRHAMQELGKRCVELVKLAGRLQSASNTNSDKMLRREFDEQIESVKGCILAVLHSFKVDERPTMAKGTQACLSADNSVNGIIADLNTVIMFATASTLKSENESDSFNDHRESVLRTAKTLVEDTKALVSVSGQEFIDQDALAQGVQTSVRTITRLADAVKLGAASLGSDQPDAQVLLINSVKDVAAALSELIGSIKLVSSSSSSSSNEESRGSRESTPEQDLHSSLLRESAKNMITNIQSLLKTVKTVEDEAARGTRALESAIEAIYQEIKLYSSYMTMNISEPHAASKSHSSVTTKPEDLIRATKQITLATSKAIGAGNSLRQDDVIGAANMGRKAVSDLLFVSRGTTSDASALNGGGGGSGKLEPDNHQQRQVLGVALNCAIYYKELLECIQTNVFNKTSTNEYKQTLIAKSKQVASTVSEILQIAELLKGNDWADVEDPTVVAENELLGAANAIEMAAEKLSALKPRTKTTTEAVDENLNFDEQILEAAKSITNAAGVLIIAATAAQKELVSQGKFQPMNSNSYEEDGQWSQGLISAARMVATACHALCEAANGLVQGHATEERLISSAKQVAASTAALLVACKVKSELTSQAMKRLQHAGNAIKRATDALVRAAQQAVDVHEEDDQYIELKTAFVGSIAQEIMLREEILRKEKELKAAQAKYNAVKKARYQREEDSPASASSSSASSSAATTTTTTTATIKERTSAITATSTNGGNSSVVVSSITHHIK